MLPFAAFSVLQIEYRWREYLGVEIRVTICQIVVSKFDRIT